MGRRRGRTGLRLPPRVADWYRRLQARPSFAEAIVRWENPKYLQLMKRQGRDSWPKIREIVASL